LKTSESITEISKALVALLPTIENIDADSKGYGYDYISLKLLLEKIRSEFGILKTSSWKSNFYPWSRNNNGDFFVWNTPNHQKVINILRGQ